MILIDTGFLVGLAVPGDQLRAVAERWHRSPAGRGPRLLTDYVVWEFVNGTSDRGADIRQRAHHLLGEMRADRQCEFVPATDTLTTAGLALHAARPDKGWSLTDCVSLLLMEERSIFDALSHDRHFLQMGRNPLLRRDP